MTKLIIENTLLQQLIQQVGPKVSAETGWDLKLESMGYRVVPKDQGYEEIVQGRFQALGAPVSAQRNLLERMMEYLIENNVLGAYQPHSQELLVVRENVDDSNLEGLSLVLGHELVHRGQHMNHPALFDRVDQTSRDVIQFLGQGNLDFDYINQKFNEIKSSMTLIESHATYITQLLKRKYYPNAVIETHFSLPVILFRILGITKVSQYVEGIPQVSEAMGRGSIDELFRSTASKSG